MYNNAIMLFRSRSLLTFLMPGVMAYALRFPKEEKYNNITTEDPDLCEIVPEIMDTECFLNTASKISPLQNYLWNHKKYLQDKYLDNIPSDLLDAYSSDIMIMKDHSLSCKDNPLEAGKQGIIAYFILFTLMIFFFFIRYSSLMNNMYKFNNNYEACVWDCYNNKYIKITEALKCSHYILSLFDNCGSMQQQYLENFRTFVIATFILLLVSMLICILSASSLLLNKKAQFCIEEINKKLISYFLSTMYYLHDKYQNDFYGEEKVLLETTIDNISLQVSGKIREDKNIPKEKTFQMFDINEFSDMIEESFADPEHFECLNLWCNLLSFFSGYFYLVCCIIFLCPLFGRLLEENNWSSEQNYAIMDIIIMTFSVIFLVIFSIVLLKNQVSLFEKITCAVGPGLELMAIEKNFSEEKKLAGIKRTLEQYYGD